MSSRDGKEATRGRGVAIANELLFAWAGAVAMIFRGGSVEVGNFDPPDQSILDFL